MALCIGAPSHYGGIVCSSSVPSWPCTTWLPTVSFLQRLLHTQMLQNCACENASPPEMRIPCGLALVLPMGAISSTRAHEERAQQAHPHSSFAKLSISWARWTTHPSLAQLQTGSILATPRRMAKKNCRQVREIHSPGANWNFIIFAPPTNALHSCIHIQSCHALHEVVSRLRGMLLQLHRCRRTSCQIHMFTFISDSFAHKKMVTLGWKLKRHMM